jgi:stearoyl-CoA desaturase (delta-9 desaturase)
MHMACLAVFFVGVSPAAAAAALLLYLARMFFITGFYHRYFSHRAFKTSRPFQLFMAVAGCSAVQRGPLWWASHHRSHHNHSDQPDDPHSPHIVGFFMAHSGWFMTRAKHRTLTENVRDWRRYPELSWIDRFDVLVPALLGAALFALGALLNYLAPSLHTTGAQMFVWGFVVSTFAVYHATFAINSLSHRFGSQRFDTGDHSRNNLLLAILTLGEGWHNNHHHYPAAARQGFYWWEIDVSWYALMLLEKCGLIWDLRGVPAKALLRNRLDRPAPRADPADRPALVAPQSL